jgi:hypothetical protein
MAIPLIENTNLVSTHKKTHFCRRCKSELDTRVPRGPFVKTFLFWLPLKRYVCYGCYRKLYKWG